MTERCRSWQEEIVTGGAEIQFYLHYPWCIGFDGHLTKAIIPCGSLTLDHHMNILLVKKNGTIVWMSHHVRLRSRLSMNLGEGLSSGYNYSAEYFVYVLPAEGTQEGRCRAFWVDECGHFRHGKMVTLICAARFDDMKRIQWTCTSCSVCKPTASFQIVCQCKWSVG